MTAKSGETVSQLSDFLQHRKSASDTVPDRVFVAFSRGSNRFELYAVTHQEAHMVRKILASLLAGLSLVGTLSTLIGCSAVEGTGRAVQRGGQEIQEEAREHGARR